MAVASPNEVTQLLEDWSNGDRAALDKLTPLVYEEMRRIAHRYMSRERAGHTLQTTALVNEAYLRLVKRKNARWQNRAHFFAVAAQIMRHILIDHARSNTRAKRGGDNLKISLEQSVIMSPERATELVALDEALNSLAEIDPRKSRIVELRYFGGMTVEEVAEVLKISHATVEREWRSAKAWLFKAVNSES
ncbi:MAG TPA: sigma-70 family RNA polymerase sigma factor [Pyrinomonadaceae bacterium]|nr:sigma-70 family RNA polymerase sigma factor [Pyrinomonadaceae bacterium]